MSRQKSHAAFARAKQLIPGGVNSPARAFGGVGGEPVFIDHAEGAYLVDIDGNRYLDYVGSWGPMILGHAHPAVTAALEQAIRRGTSFGAPTLAETQLAELITAAVPSMEKVRLVNSGTEATMSAVRLARGYTGRPMIVKFAGNYHGHVDSLLVAAGSSAATLGRAQLAGRDRRDRPRHPGAEIQRPGCPGGRLRPARPADRRRDRRAGVRQHGLRRGERRFPPGVAGPDPPARRTA